MRRRALHATLLAVVAVLVLTAGCAGPAGDDTRTSPVPPTTTATTTTDTPTTQSPTSMSSPTTTTPTPTTVKTAVADCPRSLPTPPETANATAALSFAKAYEQTLGYNLVCNKEEFGFPSHVFGVEMQTDAGVYVHAKRSYYYNHDGTEADGLTRGTYFVGNGTFVRVDWRATEHPDVETYAPNGSDASQSIRLANFAPETHQLSVRLHYVDATSPVSVLNESYSLPAVRSKRGIFLRNVAARPGQYRLVVARNGTTRTLRFDIPETDRDLPDIAVYIAPDGDLLLTRLPRLE